MVFSYLTTGVALVAPAIASLLLSVVPAVPAQEEELSMGRLYARANERLDEGDIGGAIADLDEILRRPELRDAQEVSVRILAAQCRIPYGFPHDALEDLVQAEELAVRLDSEDTPADLCHVAGTRSLAYLYMGLPDLADVWLDEMDARLALMKSLDASYLVNEVLYSDFVHAQFRAVLEEYAWLDSWLDSRLADPLYDSHPESRARLRLMRAFALRERSRLDPGLEPSAREALTEIAESELASRPDRIRAEQGLIDLAIGRSDFEEAARRLESAADELGEHSARRDPETHLRHVTLETRLAIEIGTPPGRLGELERAIERALEPIDREEPRRGGIGFLRYKSRRSALSELIRCRLLDERAAAPQRALATLLDVQDRATLFRLLGGTSTRLDDLDALLEDDPGRPLLVYFAAPERTHLFLVDAASVQAFELPTVDRIESVASDLTNALHEGASPERAALRRTLAAALADLLLPRPVRERLRATGRATIVADTFLAAVPFEVLPFGGGTLGTEVALDHLPSLSVGVLLAGRRAEPVLAGAGDVVLVAAEADPQALSKANNVSSEMLADALGAVLEGYQQDRATLLTGGDAKLSEVARRVGGAEVLQFLTHGSFDLDRERPAGLLLTPEGDGDDGFVGADEIEGLAPLTHALDAPPLVVLTACGSGRARPRVVDGGANDLAGALFLASARTRCVVATSFDLDVEATRRLTIAFQRSLADGQPPAEAMRRAREALASDERFADPVYHSPLRVIGLGHAPVFR